MRVPSLSVILWKVCHRSSFTLVTMFFFSFSFSLWLLYIALLSPSLYALQYHRRADFEVCSSDDRALVKKILSSSSNSTKSLPWIFVITPTYVRATQVPELIRIQQMLEASILKDLRLKILWIVVEDSSSCSHFPSLASSVSFEKTNRVGSSVDGTEHFLAVHLRSSMPSEFRSWDYLPSGVANRNGAFKWIRTRFKSVDSSFESLVYFLDDDNTISSDLFTMILSVTMDGVASRRTQRRPLLVFPVGLVGKFGFSSPVVKQGKVTGFHDAWPAFRTFPMDMAGFALPLDLILSRPRTYMAFHPGFEETRLLEELGVRQKDLVPLGKSDEVLVWHTRSIKPRRRSSPAKDIANHLLYEKSDNLRSLLSSVDSRRRVAPIQTPSSPLPSSVIHDDNTAEYGRVL